MHSFDKLAVIAILPIAAFFGLVGLESELTWLFALSAGTLGACLSVWALGRVTFGARGRDRRDKRSPVLLLRSFRQDAQRMHHEVPPGWVRYARLEGLVLSLFLVVFAVYRAGVEEGVRRDSLRAALTDPVIALALNGTPDWRPEAASWRSGVHARKAFVALVPDRVTGLLGSGYIVFFVFASVWWYRRERPFVDALGESLRAGVGPPIALTSRHARRARGGPTYVRAPSSGWEQVVAELLSKCGVAVVILGESEGLAWELEYIRRNGRHRHIVIVCDPRASGEMRDYARIRHTFASCGWTLPVEAPEPGSVLILDEGFRAWVVQNGAAHVSSVTAVVTLEVQAALVEEGTLAVISKNDRVDVPRDAVGRVRPRPRRDRLHERAIGRVLQDSEGLMAALTAIVVISMGAWILTERRDVDDAAVLHIALASGLAVILLLAAFQVIVEYVSRGEAPVSNGYFGFFEAFGAYCIGRIIFAFVTVLESLIVGAGVVPFFVSALTLGLVVRLTGHVMGRYCQAISVLGWLIVLEFIYAVMVMPLVAGFSLFALGVSVANVLVMALALMMLEQRRGELWDAGTRMSIR